MTLDLTSLVAMAWRTVRNPREGAEEVLALGIPREALWTILLLVVVLSVLLAQATVLIMGPGAGMMMSPVVTGLVQFVLLVMMVFAIHFVGRAMGGTGSLEEAMLLVSWLQFIMVLIQVAQTVSLLILPPVAGLLGIAGLVVFLWLLTHFIAVLHGFRSLAQVFVMILVTAFAIAFVLSILLTLTGVAMPMMSV